MEMWDGYGVSSYAKGEGEKKSSEVFVGSKIVITKPDSVSIERNALNGDIGKIVCIETDVFGVTRYLAYNPKWKCRDDGMQEDFGYDGLFIVLSRREFEVIRYENKSW